MPGKNSKPEVARKEILKIEAYKPGQSKVSGIKIPIKLSSNENPFGASPSSITAMQEAALKQHRYPDGSCAELRTAIAEAYNIDFERIVCGAGSDELIALLCQAYAGEGDEVLYSQYGFLMYPISALRSGATPKQAKEKNLRTDVDSLISEVTEKTKIVFIANPNNPTGSYVSKKEMRRLRAELRPDILLVIDSAYGEYVIEKDYSSGIGMVEENDNVVMTRTFSKIYGLAGLRLGWAYCPLAIIDILNRIRSPFNVSDMAQAAGIAAVKDREFVKKSCSHNEKWLPVVSEGIKKLGLKVYPSVANFVLVEFSDKKGKTASDADIFLKSRGIIGRAMESYSLPNCMRFTIGLEEENKALLIALEEFLKN